MTIVKNVAAVWCEDRFAVPPEPIQIKQLILNDDQVELFDRLEKNENGGQIIDKKFKGKTIAIASYALYLAFGNANTEDGYKIGIVSEGFERFKNMVTVLNGLACYEIDLWDYEPEDDFRLGKKYFNEGLIMPFADEVKLYNYFHFGELSNMDNWEFDILFIDDSCLMDKDVLAKTLSSFDCPIFY